MPIPDQSPSNPIPNPSTTDLTSVPQVAFVFQVPSIINTHLMITRSKDGIVKPKALDAKASSNESQLVIKPTKPSKASSSPKPDYTFIEPPSYKVAAQHPQWCATMDEEFAALQRQGTWSLVPPSPS